MALTNVAFQSNPPLVEPDPGDPTKPDVGLPLDPITGRNYELGAKTSWLNGRLIASINCRAR